MSQPRPPWLKDNDAFVRALLASAKRDGPSEASRTRVLTALGVAAASTAAAGTSSAATGGLLLASHPVIQGLLFGVVSGLAVAGGAAHVEASRTEPQPLSRGVTAIVREKGARASLSATAAAPSSLPPETAPVASTNTPPTRPARALAAPAPNASALRAELALLDEANRALSSADPGGALRALDRHEQTFPHAALGPEATALRIKALIARGDRASAERLAAKFLAENPTSPHAPRIRSLLGARETP